MDNADKQSFFLTELAEHSGATLIGGKNCEKVYDVRGLADAGKFDLAVLHNKKYLGEFKKTKALACIVSPNYRLLAPKGLSLLIHENPYKAFALVMQKMYGKSDYQHYVSQQAFIDDSATIACNVTLEHGAFIAKSAKVGSGSIIGANTFIGENVIIGRNCLIDHNVTICNATIGDNTTIKSGARIGQDGFGFASDKDGHYKVPHLGKVCIGCNVEIGANTCIDRGTLDDTIIADMCRIDNLVQIAHNVKIGKGCVIVSQAGIAGSSELGDFVTLGGQVGVIGHLRIGAGATVLGDSTVMKDVEQYATVAGYPAMPAMKWKRQVAAQKKQS